jgi:hypothetical protein
MKCIINHVQVTDPNIPDHALVIEQSFDQPFEEPQILVIAEREDQCFEALAKIHPDLTKEILGYDQGSYYPTQMGSSYDGGGLIVFVHEGSWSLGVASDIATFAMHMSEAQLVELQEFCVSIWA